MQRSECDLAKAWRVGTHTWDGSHGHDGLQNTRCVGVHGAMRAMRAMEHEVARTSYLNHV